MTSSEKVLSKVSSLKNIIKSDGSKHVWQFSRVGGVNRVNLESGKDLMSLEFLDQKLWTALSCPVHGLEIDYKTLELIDNDDDGRIRVPEVLEAVRWITSVLKNPDELVRENNSLALSAINDETEEGKNLLASARQILSNLGKPDALELTVEDTSDTVRIFAGTKFNGDAVITEDSTEDVFLKKLIGNIVALTGSEIDRNGKQGITPDLINTFYKSCEDFSNWHAKAENAQAQILPYGDKTAESFDAFHALKSKIDDYFLRCRLAEFDPQAVEVLNSLNSRFEEITKKDLSVCLDEIAAFPLAKIEGTQGLPLKTGVNPAWAKAMARFSDLLVKPTSKTLLTEADWTKIEDGFTGYIQWQSEKAGTEIESMGLQEIRTLLAGKSKEQLLSLIEQDKALEANTNNIILVDKLVRYYRDLYKLLNNYVTFYDFYSPDAEAIFQAGSLYIDQRRCDLCIKVSDMNKHNAIAKTSGMCLIYCDCVSKAKNQKMTIVAALTDGDFDNIEVGRNAIFYDRQGLDWDATIVKVIENPISIRQAFWSPYRKVSKFISTQIEKFASSKDKEVENMAASKVESAGAKADSGLQNSIQKTPDATAPSAAPSVPAQAFDIGKFVGIFAALSLALGAIGSVIMSVLTGFLSLSWWKMPLALIGIMLCISGPSMLLAWLKLRKRNLAPLLDANGWAVNARATINIAFGNTLTHLASLPENAKLNLIDPFAKKKNPWIPVLIILVVLAVSAYLLWRFGYLTKWGIL